MVVERERLSTSRVWLLMDVGLEMTGVCPSGERAWQVAANALRMFAALSLRRSDDISLVFGDESSITRVPFNGGFAQFERTLDKALDRDWDHHRNIDALLEYARRIKDQRGIDRIGHRMSMRWRSGISPRSVVLPAPIRWC